MYSLYQKKHWNDTARIPTRELELIWIWIIWSQHNNVTVRPEFGMVEYAHVYGHVHILGLV